MIKIGSSRMEYDCAYVAIHNESTELDKLPWQQFDSLELVDTVTGESCVEKTFVRACWSEKMLLFQFICLDFHIVSDFEQRDDPLYEQDVIEIFIDEQREGKRYMELEVSPKNVVFDAIITNDGIGNILSLDLAWDIDGLQTEVITSQPQYVTYYVRIPASNFTSPLEKDKKFKVNFYRIDEKVDGTREFQAWSPTGAIHYHLPQYFGTMNLK